jgi:Permuted papain-like amidase enzyme, YaeF/YiiX, C92 family
MNAPTKLGFFQQLQIDFIKWMSKADWKQKYHLSPENEALLKSSLEKDYYIIATRKDNQLSTFFIGLGHFLLTGKWGYYSHVLMNLEDEVKTDDDFRLIEATGKGVKYSNFDQVFDGAYAVALISPQSMTVAEWTECLDAAKTHLGTPYDNLFNLKSDLEINCVELCRIALQALPDYSTRFAAFEALIKKEDGKLTPQMFLECPDFEVKLTLKR